MTPAPFDPRICPFAVMPCATRLVLSLLRLLWRGVTLPPCY